MINSGNPYHQKSPLSIYRGADGRLQRSVQSTPMGFDLWYLGLHIPIHLSILDLGTQQGPGCHFWRLASAFCKELDWS